MLDKRQLIASTTNTKYIWKIIRQNNSYKLKGRHVVARCRGFAAYSSRKGKRKKIPLAPRVQWRRKLICTLHGNIFPNWTDTGNNCLENYEMQKSTCMQIEITRS